MSNFNTVAKACMGIGILVPRPSNRICRPIQHCIHTSTSMQHPYKNIFSYQFKSKTIEHCQVMVRNLLNYKRSNIKYGMEFSEMPGFLYTSTVMLRYIQQRISRIPHVLKQHSVHIVRMCSEQCEYVVAHKIRRGMQISTLYNRLWGERALKQLLKAFQQQIYKRGHAFLLSAACLSTFDWEKERISDDDIFGHLKEMDYIYTLVENTMTCEECSQRQIVNVAASNVEYCKCKNSTPSWKKSVDDWLPFIEGEDFLIWKKIHKEQRGMFSYKVYGNYNDVTAEDFLQVQMDVENRRGWDPTAVALNVIDEDPDTNSDVVYWEMEWPRLFTNRDYVFTRRFIIHEDKKIMLIVSQCTTHPDCPERPETYRVKDYWSFMVIRPYTDFNQPGIEFGLTYFDNPGIAIPSAVTAWVAMSGLPNFLLKLREAAREVGLKRLLSPESVDEPIEDRGSDPLPEHAIPTCIPLPTPLPEPQNVQLYAGTDDSYFQQFRLNRLFI